MPRKDRSIDWRATDRECTLETVAKELNITRAGVQLIEIRALAKVRAGLEAKGIDAQLWFSHLDDLSRRSKTVYTSGPELFFLGTGEPQDTVVEEEADTISCGSEEPA